MGLLIKYLLTAKHTKATYAKVSVVEKDTKHTKSKPYN